MLFPPNESQQSLLKLFYFDEQIFGQFKLHLLYKRLQ